MTLETGPYLQTAVLCEKVLQEKDGVLSLIRIVDRLIITASGPSAPEDMPKFPASVTGVVTLKSGSAVGPVELKLELENPSGIRSAIGSHTLLMEGQDRGQNLLVTLNLEFTEQGLYWINIYLKGIDAKGHDLLTRVPLRVVYLRTTGPQPRLV